MSMKRSIARLVLVLGLLSPAWAQPAPPPATARKEITVDQKVLQGYVGRYEVTPAVTFVVTLENGQLYTKLGPQPKVEVFAEAPNSFFLKVVDAQLTFHTDPQGKATGVTLHQNGREITWKRIVEATAESLQPRFAEIDSLVSTAYSRRSVGSVTIGIVAGDKLVWTKSYGNADMEAKTPADQDTVYRIGSITKMFTALMLEQLADAGKLHLSDPVEKYFPEVKTVQGRYADAAPITLMELATHTSGLGREPDDLDTYLVGPLATWDKTLIAALPHTHYQFEPGTQFSYSNIGFAILGAAISRVAGEAYQAYVPKHIFEPLGMTHTALETNPAMLPHLSKGYEVGPKGSDATTPQRELAGRGYKVPNGAMFTTVGDLAHFASFLLGAGPETVLKTESLNKYLNQMAVPADFNLTNGYGIGFEVSHRENYIAYGHNGGVAGYNAGLYMNRRAGRAGLDIAGARYFV
jgi:CubicO group peptidase (beta-lactamase class C family)